jgi:tripartite-type tricarboxylate transporter receptor subunit TctC
LGDKKAGAVPFDKMEWVGAPSRGEIVCMIMAFTGKTTWKDVINSKEPIKIGATRAGSTGHDIPAILNKAMGTKFKIVTGYRGTATIRLALEGREVDGFCSQWESMRVTARSMLDAEGGQKLVPFVIDSHSYPDPEIQSLPLFKDVLNKEALQLYNSWAFQMAFQRMLALPPGTPKDRLEILQTAYAKTLKDPQMLAEAKKAKLVVTPVSGPEVKRLVDEILNMPQNVKESLSFLVRK